MIDVGTLRARVIADTTEYDKQLDAAQGSLSGLQQGAAKATTGLRGLTDGLVSIGEASEAAGGEAAGSLADIQQEAASAAPAVVEVAQALASLAARNSDVEATAAALGDVAAEAVGLQEVQAEAAGAGSGLADLAESVRHLIDLLTRSASGLLEAADALKEVGKSGREAGDETEKGAKKATDSLTGLQKAARRAKSQIGSLASGVTHLGGAVGGASGQVAQMAQGMLGAFAMGGAIGLGIAAVGAGVERLASHIRETGTNARQLEAMGTVFRVTDGDVQQLRSSLQALGADVDQKVAQQIMLAGKQAGLTTGEIQNLASQIKRTADLTAGELGPAAQQVFAQQKRDVDDLIRLLDRAADSRRAALVGVSEEARMTGEAGRKLEEEKLGLLLSQEKAEAAVLRQKREVAKVEAQVARLSEARGNHQGSTALLSRLDREQEKLKALQIAAAGAKGDVDSLTAAQRKLADSAREAAEQQEALRRQAEFMKAIKETTAALKRQSEEASRAAAAAAKETMDSAISNVRAVEEYNKRVEAAEVEGAARRKEIAADVVAKEAEIMRAAADQRLADSERALASGWITETQFVQRKGAIYAQQQEAERVAQRASVLALEAARDRAIEIEQEKAAAHLQTWETTNANVEAITEQHGSSLMALQAQHGARAANIERTKVSEARAAKDRLLADQERDVAAGISAGGNFLSGMKRAFESGDGKALFGSFLSLLGQLAGLGLMPGGNIAAATLGSLGGLFHQGGMVGSGGAPLPKYHGGGMLVAHNGVMLGGPPKRPGEVDIRAELGEGVLSRIGVTAAGGPAAVRQFNRGESAGGSGAPVFNLNFGGSLIHRDILARELGPVLRSMVIEALDPVSRGLAASGPRLANLTTRG